MPGIKVLFVSGYTDDIVKDGVYGVLEEGLAFLQKPYTRHAFTRKVREILDSAPAKSITSLAIAILPLVLFSPLPNSR
jgi:hypothetical protein